MFHVKHINEARNAMKSMHRPARITSGHAELDAEMRSARWIHHRLLDFEDAHQRVLDEAAEVCAPGIVRVARIITALLGRANRAQRATGWSPPAHTAWLPELRSRLNRMRKRRNSDDRWKSALKWADTPAPGAPPRGPARRKQTESDAEYADRCSTRRNVLTRREAWRAELYRDHVAVGATARSRVYWGTWNSLLSAVDTARQAVLKARRAGMPAQWSRPRWDKATTLAADSGGYRVVSRGGGLVTAKSGAQVGNPWWVVKVRIADGWVKFRAKFGNWHAIDGATLKGLELTRHRDGERWQYSASVVVDGAPSAQHPGTGIVGLDWGHRERGHDAEATGMRVFTWLGDDNERGEVLLPVECRELLDSIDATKSRADKAFDARRSTLKLRHKNRYRYRSHLMRGGVRSAEESDWLRWEMRQERRLMRMRKRIDNLRHETYSSAIRGLRQRYSVFATEDESTAQHQQLDIKEKTRGRKRQNRDLSARYEFVSLCEWLGAEVLLVPSRNTTRECPTCGHLDENTAELWMVCTSCGIVRDKDFGAARLILRRGKAALALRAAT